MNFYLSYPSFFFFLKYVICLWLIIDLTKKKKVGTLFKSILLTFIGFSIVIFVNLIFSIFTKNHSEFPFYYINFIDFILVSLLLNKFLLKAPKEN